MSSRFEHEITDLDLIIQLLYSEPHVRACISKMKYNCLQGDVTFKEEGKQLKTEFQTKIKNHYWQFLINAIPVIFGTGFVAFVVKRVGDVDVPICLPMGTYTWCVETCNVENKNFKMKNLNSMLRYAITPLNNIADASKICVVPFVDPVLTKLPNFSPMYAVLQEYKYMLNLMETVHTTNKWNASKHLVITEQVDLKDQTTSGIQLLDEQRRYQLTGQHNNISHNSLLQLQNKNTGKRIASVRDAIFTHVRSEFDGGGEGKYEMFDENAPGSKRACTHIMPPNLQVQELSSLPLMNITEIDAKFANAVYSFFSVSGGMATQIGSKTSSSASSESLSQEELQTYQFLSKFLCYLCEMAYATCQKIDSSMVKASMRTMTKMDASSSSDIKAYADAEILSGGDKQGIRRKLKE